MEMEDAAVPSKDAAVASEDAAILCWDAAMRTCDAAVTRRRFPDAAKYPSPVNTIQGRCDYNNWDARGNIRTTATRAITAPSESSSLRVRQWRGYGRGALRRRSAAFPLLPSARRQSGTACPPAAPASPAHGGPAHIDDGVPEALPARPITLSKRVIHALTCHLQEPASSWIPTSSCPSTPPTPAPAHSRSPQAEQRVYGRQTSSTVRVVILTESYKMPTEHNIIPGGQSYKTLAIWGLAGRLNGWTSG
ncbi:hypothetical protein B0H13DRAFT_2278852 [Mycena leptocephala]|nr:hypothetical protein B0H13DRAFT_2278852 [Mycena leptocephala]